jgi:hypothetical protein
VHEQPFLGRTHLNVEHIALIFSDEGRRIESTRSRLAAVVR